MLFRVVIVALILITVTSSASASDVNLKVYYEDSNKNASLTVNDEVCYFDDTRNITVETQVSNLVLNFDGSMLQGGAITIEAKRYDTFNDMELVFSDDFESIMYSVGLNGKVIPVSFNGDDKRIKIKNVDDVTYIYYLGNEDADIAKEVTEPTMFNFVTSLWDWFKESVRL